MLAALCLCYVLTPLYPPPPPHPKFIFSLTLFLCYPKIAARASKRGEEEIAKKAEYEEPNNPVH